MFCYAPRIAPEGPLEVPPDWPNNVADAVSVIVGRKISAAPIPKSIMGLLKGTWVGLSLCALN